MHGARLSASRLRNLGEKAFLGAHEAAEQGVNSRGLRHLMDEGSIEGVARGLYRFTEAELTEHYTTAAVCAWVPDAIGCLLSAVTVYEIGAPLPWQVWIAIPHKCRRPRLRELPAKVVRFSGVSLRHGVVNTTFEGVPARITSPARTVVDCFFFRRLVGKEAAIEAVRDAVWDRKATIDQISRAGEVCRTKSLVFPVLEAMSV